MSQGRLPETHGFYVSYDGPPSRHLERTERRQFASAHPPLFYALASVVEGGALEDGQWPTAVARIRALNTVLGVGTLLIIAWAAWRLGGRRRAQLMIVSCALAGLVYPFVRHSADVYSDLLVTFLSTAAIALALVGRARAAGTWPSWRCAAGMATKATGETRTVRMGRYDVQPLGGGAACLGMLLFSLLASVFLTVVVNLLLR